MPQLRLMADQLVAADKNLVVALVSVEKDVAQIFVKVGSGISTQQFHAGNTIKGLTQSFGGGGGGRETMAQAGGLPAHEVDNALTYIRNQIQQ